MTKFELTDDDRRSLGLAGREQDWEKTQLGDVAV
jgi:hypothetical protein